MPQSSALLILAVSITVHELCFVSFDQSSGDQRHEGDGKELGQRTPGEDVVQSGDL